LFGPTPGTKAVWRLNAVTCCAVFNVALKETRSPSPYVKNVFPEPKSFTRLNDVRSPSATTRGLSTNEKLPVPVVVQPEHAAPPLPEYVKLMVLAATDETPMALTNNNNAATRVVCDLSIARPPLQVWIQSGWLI